MDKYDETAPQKCEYPSWNVGKMETPVDFQLDSNKLDIEHSKADCNPQIERLTIDLESSFKKDDSKIKLGDISEKDLLGTYDNKIQVCVFFCQKY